MPKFFKDESGNIKWTNVIGVSVGVAVMVAIIALIIWQVTSKNNNSEFTWYPGKYAAPGAKTLKQIQLNPGDHKLCEAECAKNPDCNVYAYHVGNGTCFIRNKPPPLDPNTFLLNTPRSPDDYGFGLKN